MGGGGGGGGGCRGQRLRLAQIEMELRAEQSLSIFIKPLLGRVKNKILRMNGVAWKVLGCSSKLAEKGWENTVMKVQCIKPRCFPKYWNHTGWQT